jgi:hypothetical protein
MLHQQELSRYAWLLVRPGLPQGMPGEEKMKAKAKIIGKRREPSIRESKTVPVWYTGGSTLEVSLGNILRGLKIAFDLRSITFGDGRQIEVAEALSCEEDNPYVDLGTSKGAVLLGLIGNFLGIELRCPPPTKKTKMVPPFQKEDLDVSYTAKQKRKLKALWDVDRNQFQKAAALIFEKEPKKSKKARSWVGNDGIFHCRCGYIHQRGPINGVDAYRCIHCGKISRITNRTAKKLKTKGTK